MVPESRLGGLPRADVVIRRPNAIPAAAKQNKGLVLRRPEGLIDQKPLPAVDQFVRHQHFGIHRRLQTRWKNTVFEVVLGNGVFDTGERCTRSRIFGFVTQAIVRKRYQLQNTEDAHHGSHARNDIATSPRCLVQFILLFFDGHERLQRQE